MMKRRGRILYSNRRLGSLQSRPICRLYGGNKELGGILRGAERRRMVVNDRYGESLERVDMNPSDGSHKGNDMSISEPMFCLIRQSSQKVLQKVRQTCLKVKSSSRSRCMCSDPMLIELRMENSLAVMWDGGFVGDDVRVGAEWRFPVGMDSLGLCDGMVILIDILWNRIIYWIKNDYPAGEVGFKLTSLPSLKG